MNTILNQLAFDQTIDLECSLEFYDQIHIDRDYIYKAWQAEMELKKVQSNESDKKKIEQAQQKLRKLTWTAEDDKRLLKLYSEVGAQYDYLGKCLEKEPKQVKAKLHKLRREHLLELNKH